MVSILLSHRNLIHQSPALFHATNVYSRCGKQTMQSIHNETKQNATNHTVTHASIWIFMSSLKQLTVASFPPVSLGDGGCWTIMNSTSKYSASMNGATLRHEWAFVSLWCAVKQASKIQVNSPMRLRLKIRHGDMWTWPRYEPLPQIPCRRIVCSGTVEKTSQRLKNSLFISCRSLGVLSLAVPTSPFQAIGHSLTGQWFNYGAGINYVLSIT